MNGNEIFNKQYNDKINNYIEKSNYRKVLTGYNSYIENVGISNTSRYNYISIVNSFLKENQDLNILDYDDYSIYINTKTKEFSSYRTTVYYALKYFAEYLEVSRNIINPIISMKKPKFRDTYEKREKRQKGYLTSEELKIYKQHIVEGVGSNKAKATQKTWKNRDEALILLMLCTGLRCSAVYKLDIENVNMNTHTISVTEKGHKIRNLPFSDKLSLILSDWLKDRQEKLNGKEEKALFISNRRTRMSKDAISSVVNKYSRGIEGKHITPHKLRHTFADQLMNQVHDLKSVQAALGHSNLATTERYFHGADDFTVENAEIIANAIL